MEKITFILPLHKIEDKTGGYFSKAIASVESLKGDRNDYALCVIAPTEVINVLKDKYIPNDFKTKITYLENNENTGFFEQVNKAVMSCVSQYFSVLEVDDMYNDFAAEEFLKYKSKNTASVYMPINEIHSDDDKIFGFCNEIAWAHSFSTADDGYVDLESLMTYMDFNVTGAFIKTEDFISVGMLKPSLGIVSWYEFLMRLCNNDKKIFVFPKSGYVHTVMRDGSYSKTESANMTQDKAKWLIDTAREEYKYNTEREVKYEKGE